MIPFTYGKYFSDIFALCFGKQHARQCFSDGSYSDEYCPLLRLCCFPVAPVCRWAEEPALPTWEPKASLKPMQHSCVFHSPERWHASANSVAASPPTQERFPAKSSGCQPDLYLPPNTLSAPFKFGIWESAWVLLIEAEANQWWNRKSGKLGIFNAGFYLWEAACQFPLPIPTCARLCYVCVFFFAGFLARACVVTLVCHVTVTPPTSADHQKQEKIYLHAGHYHGI